MSQLEKINLLYIVSNGHSGSTILSFILGSDKNIFNAGELKMFNEHRLGTNKSIQVMKNFCSCGQPAMGCPFWQKIDMAGQNLNICLYSSLSFKNKFISYLKLVCPFYRFSKSKESSDDFKLLKIIQEEVKKDNSNLNYLLDASKSLIRLAHLNSHKNINIKVIYLVRDGRGFINSMRKVRMLYVDKEYRRKGFLIWVFQWLFNNITTIRYLKKERIDYYHLSYDKFCQDPPKYLKELNQKFNLEIPLDYVKAVRNTGFHVRAGNPIKAKINDFSGLHYDFKWKKELPKIYRFIASILLYGFNRKWVYGKKR